MTTALNVGDLAHKIKMLLVIDAGQGLKEKRAVAVGGQDHKEKNITTIAGPDRKELM